MKKQEKLVEGGNKMNKKRLSITKKQFVETRPRLHFLKKDLNRLKSVAKDSNIHLGDLIVHYALIMLNGELTRD